MINYNFAAIGRPAKAFQEHIEKQYANCLDCKVFESYDELTANIHQFNALAAFDLPDHVPLSNIMWIHSFGAGVDSFTKRDDLASDLILTRTLGDMGRRMGEYCLAYVLADLKNLFETAENQQRKNWSPLLSQDLYDQSVYIFGTGAMGSAVAKVFQPHCKQVMGINQSGSHPDGFTDIIRLGKDFNVAEIDTGAVIINTMPLTETTNKYFSSNVFDRWKDALFINVGRGKSVENQALLDALSSGKVRKAVLDVFDKEPLPVGNRLWAHPQVVITPHHASKTSIADMIKSFDNVMETMLKLKGRSGTPYFVNLQKGY